MRENRMKPVNQEKRERERERERELNADGTCAELRSPQY
jgi:hypothetical protein